MLDDVDGGNVNLLPGFNVVPGNADQNPGSNAGSPVLGLGWATA